jgi:tetratricopeptide (TPR) repeat protein
MPLHLLPVVAFAAIALPLQQAPETPTAPVAPVASAIAGAKPLVTVQLTDSPKDPKFEEFLKSLPPVSVQIDPELLQTALAAANAPVARDTPLAAKLRQAYLQLTPQQRLNNEPTWKYGINPILWVNRTKSTTLDWWRTYKTTLSADRLQISEVYPFAYDINASAAATTPRGRARAMMNQGIDAAMGQGDFVRAEDLLYKAVTADPTYSLAPYNAGVLQMCRYNAEPAIKMFGICSKRTPPTVIQEHADGYRENMRRMIIMLLNNSGSQRRIYTESIDAAWALYNLGQYRAAAVFAGQAAALDREEARPEAHFLIAMICAQQNRDADTVRWLQYCLERCRGSASKIVGAALKEAQGAAPVAVPPAEKTTPSVTPPTPTTSG